MIFIAAGMGGGTGTGAAPVIAQAAKDQGILSVGVVTKPFGFEGARRMRIAEGGVDELRDVLDTLIIIPNQNLFRLASAQTSLSQAFALADDVLHAGVRGITDLMVMPGLINLDFADVRTVMSEMGAAMMGTGEAQGENRAQKAAEAAINNPLLDDISMKGARGVLINITGGDDMTLFEVDEAANLIRSEVDPDAQIILGSAFDHTLNGGLRVSVVATGIDNPLGRDQSPPTTTASSAPAQPAAQASPAAPPATNPPQATGQSSAFQRPVITPPAAGQPAPQPEPAPAAQPQHTPVFQSDAQPSAPSADLASSLQTGANPTMPQAEPVGDETASAPAAPAAEAPVINPRPQASPPPRVDVEKPAQAPAQDAPAAQTATQPAPEPAPQPAAKPASSSEGGDFSGLFGWRRQPNEGGSDDAAKDQPKKADAVSEDDLEIPAFLRRSANN